MDVSFVNLETVTGPFLDDEAVAVGIWYGGIPGRAAQILDEQGGDVSHFLQVLKKTGKTDFSPSCLFTQVAPPRLGAGWLFLAGLGHRRVTQSTTDAEKIGAEVGAALVSVGAEKATLALMESPKMAAHIALGLLLRCGPPPAVWKEKKARRAAQPRLKNVVIATSDPDTARQLFASLHALADSILLARRLTVAPANLMGTRELARQAEELRKLGVEVEVLGRRQIAAQGLNLLAAVGQGSESPPRLVCLRWKGEGAPKRPVALVGKGIVFDTGGISIKPAAGMEDMKGDMGGAAAVLAAIRTMALRRAPVHAVGVLAIAENMVSGHATRPGDVVYAMNGKTVEIIDTDAEGRLVLADALTWVCRTHRPSSVVSIATLTGSVVVTLGRRYAGLMTPHDPLAARLASAARQTGEAVWRLPFDPAYAKALKSEIADLRNCTWQRGPDALHAACFLSHFVEPATRWAHLDIAGVSETAEDLPLCPKGATGFGARLLTRWIELEQAGRS